MYYFIKSTDKSTVTTKCSSPLDSEAKSDVKNQSISPPNKNILEGCALSCGTFDVR